MFSISWFHLPSSLWMIRCGYFVLHPIFRKKVIKLFVAKVSNPSLIMTFGIPNLVKTFFLRWCNLRHFQTLWRHHIPIIRGWTFLATTNAIINCRNEVMQLTFGNMTFELNVFHLCKRHPNQDEDEQEEVTSFCPKGWGCLLSCITLRRMSSWGLEYQKSLLVMEVLIFATSYLITFLLNMGWNIK